jgi:hypothetical protein
LTIHKAAPYACLAQFAERTSTTTTGVGLVIPQRKHRRMVAGMNGTPFRVPATAEALKIAGNGPLAYVLHGHSPPRRPSVLPPNWRLEGFHPTKASAIGGWD